MTIVENLKHFLLTFDDFNYERINEAVSETLEVFKSEVKL